MDVLSARLAASHASTNPTASTTTSPNPLRSVVESQKKKILSLHSSLEAARARNELLQSKSEVFSRSQDAMEEKLRVAQAESATAKRNEKAYVDLYRATRKEVVGLKKEKEEGRRQRESYERSRDEHDTFLIERRSGEMRLLNASTNELERTRVKLVEENARLMKADVIRRIDSPTLPRCTRSLPPSRDISPPSRDQQPSRTTPPLLLRPHISYPTILSTQQHNLFSRRDSILFCLLLLDRRRFETKRRGHSLSTSLDDHHWRTPFASRRLGNDGRGGESERDVGARGRWEFEFELVVQVEGEREGARKLWKKP